MTHYCAVCSAHGIVTPATHRGEWVDGEGVPSGALTLLCAECAEAGSPTGPGYREVESIVPPVCARKSALYPLGTVECASYYGLRANTH